MNNYFKSFIVVFSLVIIAIISLLSLGDLNSKEAGLLSIVLTIISIFVAWGITHYYSEISHKQIIQDVKEEHQKNLRMYGIKAAEKVNNLSKELIKLAIYLQRELDCNDYEGIPQMLLAREERIESAIHLINTLKSVNDTSLSDWEGVIGEELNRQREEKVEQVEEINNLTDRLSSILGRDRNNTDDSTSKGENNKLEEELFSIKRDVKLLLTALTGTSWKNRNTTHFKKIFVEKHCPVCNKNIKYKQKGTPLNLKPLTCPICFSELESICNSTNEFSLEVRKKANKNFPCPSCGCENNYEIDKNFPTETFCKNCKHNIRIYKINSTQNYQLKLVSSGKKHFLNEEIIQKVKECLPKQPWNKGIHKFVAEQLGIAPQVVSKAIDALILRNDVLDQVDGIVCTPEEARSLRLRDSQKSGEDTDLH
jgi:hypothetical protein